MYKGIMAQLARVVRIFSFSKTLIGVHMDGRSRYKYVKNCNNYSPAFMVVDDSETIIIMSFIAYISSQNLMQECSKLKVINERVSYPMFID